MDGADKIDSRKNGRVKADGNERYVYLTTRNHIVGRFCFLISRVLDLGGRG